jgi:hypothetical protein
MTHLILWDVIWRMNVADFNYLKKGIVFVNYINLITYCNNDIISQSQQGNHLVAIIFLHEK